MDVPHNARSLGHVCWYDVGLGTTVGQEYDGRSRDAGERIQGKDGQKRLARLWWSNLLPLVHQNLYARKARLQPCSSVLLGNPDPVSRPYFSHLTQVYLVTFAFSDECRVLHRSVERRTNFRSFTTAVRT